ncbi:MAG: ABC transporter ATP-binding protein/permease [Anaerolineae bacterium]|jgi:ATP-binding cassette subfamily B protein|nr:ABC transporter ATP-binding protein/permease [Anaerolineae bacterium]MDH7472904.1 ABC transporter ATP-binding protein [Anaerolineae bacterium]
MVRQQPPPITGIPGPGSRHRGTTIEKARDVRGTLRRLLATLQPFRWALVGVLVLVVVSTLLDLLAPYLMGIAIDRFIAQKDRAGLQRVVLLMLGAYLGIWLTQAGQSMIIARFSQKAMRTLRRNLFEHLQTLSLSFFDRHPHGELMSRLTNDMDAISRVLSQNVTDLFSGLLTLAGILVVMFVINFWLALGSMIVFPFMMWLVGFVGKRTRRHFREYQMRLGQLNGKLEEMFSGQRVIMAFGQQASTLADFDQANEQVRRVGIRANTYAMLIPPLMGILSNANIAILAGLGGWMTLRGWATVGTIATFYTYSRRFAAPLRQLGDLYNQIQSALAGAERIFEIIDTEPELTDVPDAIALEDVAGEVVFDHVNFSYVPGVPVIKDMSLVAKPGQTIALVGPTGAGKTTMVNLLSRFYDIDSGAIRIDGHDIRQVQRASLRRQLGVVLQDTFLFSDTVMENIRYGRLDATDEEVIAAARLANADQFIRRLPKGYQTELSERGSNLSQGQRQLLAIARAVLADPGILILDEATSSVDTRTEKRIQEAMLRLMEGRTSFVIAHRLSTIRQADKILVIRDGRLIEQGTHDELLARRGFYQHLYMSQFKTGDSHSRTN